MACSMYGTCGSSLGTSIPCPDSSPARDHSTEIMYEPLLEAACGPDFVRDTNLHTCCDLGSVQQLQASFAQVAPLISQCPSCHENFKRFFCEFTCSPNQHSFVNVTKVDPKTSAVSEAHVTVSPTTGSDFFESCKDVKFGALNGRAMDLIGGGAESWLDFLRFTGEKRPLGSPFQINYDPGQQGLHFPVQSCSEGPNRCACADCPDVCGELPPLPPSPNCSQGFFSCNAWVYYVLYAIICLGIIFFRKKLKQKEVFSSGLKSRDSSSGLAGPALDANALDRSNITGSSGFARESLPTPSEHTPTSEGVPQNPFYQPRLFRLDVNLSIFFYNLGHFCASNPFRVLLVWALVCSVAHIGWTKFKVERDPVRLWVPETSTANIARNQFNTDFGPFFRTQQVILSSKDGLPVLSYDLLQWWSQVESNIRQLSYHNMTLGDFCFIAQSQETQSSVTNSLSSVDASNCVILSPLAYLGNTLRNVNETTWARALNHCASNPALCLAPSGALIKPKQIIGGSYPHMSPGELPKLAEAPAIIITWVFNNSNDHKYLKKVKAFEKVLSNILFDASKKANLRYDVQLAFSTESSLEHELDASTDAQVIILSYLLMFLYVIVNLGTTGSVLVSSIFSLFGLSCEAFSWCLRFFKTGPQDAEQPQRSRQRIQQLNFAFYKNLLVDSRIVLGTCGIAIVLLSMSTSAALFSFLDIRVTLIIAEVIPFLVLAIGVDNVFLLVHDLESQTSQNLDSIIYPDQSANTETGHSLLSLLRTKLRGITRLWLSSPETTPLLHETSSGSYISSPAGRANRASSFTPLFADITEEDGLPVDVPAPVEERIAFSVSRVGPSILLSCACQTFVFALGAFVGMPAVRNFAIYAAGAVLLNACLQTTAFVALLSLDLYRSENNLMDLLPCVTLGSSGASLFFSRASGNIALTTTAPMSAHRRSQVDGDSFTGVQLASSDLSPTPAKGSGPTFTLASFFGGPFSKMLMRPFSKFIVCAAFALLFAFNCAYSKNVTRGLDQRLALPESSHLVQYFDALDSYLNVGPPVYFIVGGSPQSIGASALLNGSTLPTGNLSERSTQIEICSRFAECDPFSAGGILEAERKRPNVSLLADPPSVWLDDFFSWTNPLLDACCRVYKMDPSTFCPPDEPFFMCKPCFEDHEPPWGPDMKAFPVNDTFAPYVWQWLSSTATADCPVAGSPAYLNAVQFDADGLVAHSYVSTFHEPLNTQERLIEAYAQDLRISREIESYTGLKVYPYSVFHVFFEQYLDIYRLTHLVLGSSILGITLISGFLLGSWRTGFCVGITVMSATMCVIGSMGAFGIQLSGLTLVNLVISVGLASEFCVHVARGFMFVPPGSSIFSKNGRARAALALVGSPLLTGITATKIIGISTLALSKSQLLRLVYLRQWLTVIISGSLHALFLLPVVLSLIGGEGFAAQDDEEWIDSAIHEAYPESEII